MNGEWQNTISFAEFELDLALRQLRRGGTLVPIKAKTFDLLVFLAENSGRTVTKDEILEAVWAGQFVEEANLSVQISALRKTFGETKTAPRFLVTIPGVGYKFIADVKSEDDEIIIEKHKFERIALDEEINAPQNAEPGQLPAGRRRNRRAIFAFAAFAALILVGFIGYKYFYAAPKTQIRSLAVLPFGNQAGDANTEYLSDGLAESVIYTLSGFPELRVMSRNSAFRYKTIEADAKTIGRSLNVEAVLTGRIVQIGDNLSVRAELVSATDNSVIWGEQFTRKMSDIEKLQTDIARSISQKLRLKLSGTDERQLKNTASENPEAYRLYLLGRFHLNKFADEGFYKGRDYFQQAIDKDPNYAPAYAGLAEAYNRLCGYNVLPSNECFPKARQAAQKALELDDQLAEAHATLGSIKHFYDWDFAGAEKDFKRAIEINPSDAEARQLYSYYLSAMERFDESLGEMRRAHELDPLSIEKINGIGEIFYYQRQYDRAIEEFQKSLEIDANSSLTHWEIGRALADKGAFNEAIPAIQKSVSLLGSNSPDELLELARAYARSGKSTEARKIIDEVKRLSEGKMHFSPVVIASVYGALGEKDQAFVHLEKAYAERDFLLVMLKIDPMFEPLRDDPRFTDLVRRVGLPQ